MKDPIIQEVREARGRHARRFGKDLDAICRDFEERQSKSPGKLVRFRPKLLKKPGAPS